MIDPAVTRYSLAPGVVVRPFDVRTSTNACLVEGLNGARWEVSAATGSLLQKLGAGQTIEQIANTAATELDAMPNAEQLSRYLDSLVVQGMVRRWHDGSDEPVVSSSVPRTRLATLALRATLLPERWAAALSAPMQWLMTPYVFWPALSLVAGASFAIWWRAGGASTIAPGRLFAAGAIVLVLLGGVVHELGHVAAARRFGAAHGRVGIGLYLLFPVFFVELDDVWRLSRAQRSIVDLAGIFAQLLFAGATLIVAEMFGTTAPGFVLIAQAAFVASAVNAVVNLNPIFRFDGYWLLGDALGIANLRTKSLALLKSLASGKSLRDATDYAQVGALGPSLVLMLLIYSALSIALLAWWMIRLVQGMPAYVRGEFVPSARILLAELGSGAMPSAGLWFAVLTRTTVIVVLTVALLAMLRNVFGRWVLHSASRYRENH